MYFLFSIFKFYLKLNHYIICTQIYPHSFRFSTNFVNYRRFPLLFHIALVILPLHPTHTVRYFRVLSPQDNQGIASLSDSPSHIHICPFHQNRDHLPSTTLQPWNLFLHIKSSLVVSSISTLPVLQNPLHNVKHSVADLQHFILRQFLLSIFFIFSSEIFINVHCRK